MAIKRLCLKIERGKREIVLEDRAWQTPRLCLKIERGKRLFFTISLRVKGIYGCAAIEIKPNDKGDPLAFGFEITRGKGGYYEQSIK
jgi:hypothetical protein